MPSGSNNILAKMAVLISANNAEFNRALSDSSAKLLGFEKSFLGLGRTIAGGLGIYSLGQTIISAVQSLAAFEKGMSEVKAITGATGDEFTKLRDNALNLAGAFKAIDISHMERDLARLGFTTQEILDTTSTSIQLATATGENLAKSADILGSTLRAFNLNANESGRVGEVMAAGFNRTALSLDNFGEAMKYVAPVAEAANISLEQTTALLGVLADANIRGSMAGTSLRKIMSDIGHGAGPVLIQRLKEMAAAQINGNQAMDEAGRTAYASLLVIVKNIEKYERLAKEIGSTTGELKKMSEAMQDNLSGDWDKLSASFDRGIQKGTIFSFILRQLTQSANAWFDLLTGQRSKFTEALFENLFDRFTGAAQSRQAINTRIDRGTAAGNHNDVEGFRAAMKKGFNSAPPTPTPEDPYSHASVLSQSGMSGYINSLLEIAKLQAPVIDNAARMDELTEKYGSMTVPAVSVNIDELKKTVTDLNIKDLNNQWKQMDDGMVKLQLSARQLGNAIRSALTGALSGLGQALGNAITGIGNFGDDILKIIAGFATQIGELSIGIGVSMLAVKNSWNNPGAAIAAGIALVALGTALSNVASSMSGSGTSTSNNTRVADQTRQPLVINITGELQAKNGVLTAVLQHEGYVRKRTGG